MFPGQGEAILQGLCQTPGLHLPAAEMDLTGHSAPLIPGGDIAEAALVLVLLITGEDVLTTTLHVIGGDIRAPVCFAVEEEGLVPTLLYMEGEDLVLIPLAVEEEGLTHTLLAIGGKDLARNPLTPAGGPGPTPGTADHLGLIVFMGQF